ncbi:MAG: alpha-L-fucosidase [Akkermansiaceae bacterium]|nr:alpha-L-fucosidase [Akkermansiaceae bacterium]
MKAILSLFLALITAVNAESPAERDARMQWFREARFGMFIHWGLYSVAAGEWDGKRYGGGVEWIQSLARIPVAEYTPLKDRFNPVKYDPDAWVRLARDAGMRYVVITSKHHDGFCLWDSKLTDWDVAASPWGKDLLKPLAEACRKYDMKFCLYHSIMDWHHPQWGNKEPWRGNSATDAPDMDAYAAYMKGQLKELLTEYGDVGILWFDGEWESAWTHERGTELDDYVRSLQPAIIVNNRVDKGRKGMEGATLGEHFRGDYGTPEQQIPANGIPGEDWESCMTMNDTWGFSAHDQNWKSSTVLIRNLIDVASKGGNYLLNIGPTPEGEIPQASVDRLGDIAKWMESNSEAIHGTTANPFPTTPWGRCTMKAVNGGTRLYLHVFDMPADRRLLLTGMRNPIRSARFLAAPQEALRVEAKSEGAAIIVDRELTDPAATVIVVEIEGRPELATPPGNP